jgi:hypothetical protein
MEAQLTTFWIVLKEPNVDGPNQAVSWGILLALFNTFCFFIFFGTTWMFPLTGRGLKLNRF